MRTPRGTDPGADPRPEVWAARTPKFSIWCLFQKSVVESGDAPTLPESPTAWNSLYLLPSIVQLRPYFRDGFCLMLVWTEWTALLAAWTILWIPKRLSLNDQNLVACTTPVLVNEKKNQDLFLACFHTRKSWVCFSLAPCCHWFSVVSLSFETWYTLKNTAWMSSSVKRILLLWQTFFCFDSYRKQSCKKWPCIHWKRNDTCITIHCMWCSKTESLGSLPWPQNKLRENKCLVKKSKFLLVGAFCIMSSWHKM